MASDKKRKQLLKILKKREKNGIAKPAVVKPLKMKRGERDRFTQKNSMVLLAIEKTIIALADVDEGLDDRSIHRALASSIRSQDGSVIESKTQPAMIRTDFDHDNEGEDVSPAKQTRQLIEDLKRRYESFFPANDSTATGVWVDGMRAIYTSVCTLSTLAPGEKLYLQRARQFQARLKGR